MTTTRIPWDEPISNPWGGLTPACPRCHVAERVYLWSPGAGWYCAACHLRFSERGRKNGTGHKKAVGGTRTKRRDTS